MEVEVEERWRDGRTLGEIKRCGDVYDGGPWGVIASQAARCKKEVFLFARCEEVSPRHSQLHIPPDKACLSRIFLTRPTNGGGVSVCNLEEQNSPQSADPPNGKLLRQMRGNVV